MERFKHISAGKGFGAGRNKIRGTTAERKVCKEEAIKEEKPKKVKENRRKYRANNLEKVKESKRKYRADNLEKVKERQRQYYAKKRQI